jgi:hypothetical protein
VDDSPSNIALRCFQRYSAPHCFKTLSPGTILLLQQVPVVRTSPEDNKRHLDMLTVLERKGILTRGEIVEVIKELRDTK